MRVLILELILITSKTNKNFVVTKMYRLCCDKHILTSPFVQVGDHRTREATIDATKLCTYSQSVHEGVRQCFVSKLFVLISNLLENYYFI